MTLTIELTPEAESALQTAAAQKGVSAPQFAVDLLMTALEDWEDGIEATQILAQSDPEKRRTLDELRQAIRGPKVNGTS